MIFGMQLIGILFGLIMIFFTYNNYKRKQYTKEAFAMWLLVWLAVIFVFSSPKMFYGIMELLHVQRTADFFTALALIFLTTLSFYMYSVVKKTENRMEELVRRLAYDNEEKNTHRK